MVLVVENRLPLSVNDVGVLAGVGLRFGDVVFPVWEDKGAGLW